MLPLEQAQEQVLARIRSLGSETVALSQGQGRFVTGAVLADRDLPPFDNSAMDGYAVRAADLKNASPDHPVPLELIGAAAAGEVFRGTLSSGQCVRIFTGSPLPAGADAVIMQEDTRAVAEKSPQVQMLDAVKPWDHVRFKGEDIRTGDPVLEVGTRLDAAQLALLAALGCAEVRVSRRPVVGLIATGSELREPGAPLQPGQIYESNRISLAALAAQAGAIPQIYPLVPDELTATEDALVTAFAQCDAVVTSGGVSVGEKDLVKAALEKIGGQLDFWRVAIKPGKPFVLGSLRDKLLFGLPGNPVSALVTFFLLARPALLKMQDARELQLPARMGILDEAVTNPGDRRHFVRVHVDSAGQVRSAGTQASHRLMSLAQANGLLDMAPGMALRAGTPVKVLTLV